MRNRNQQLVVLAIGVAVATFVLYDMVVTVNPQVQATMQAAEQWCHSMNGTLGVSRVIGEHGGLHCRAPNGTLLEYQ